MATVPQLERFQPSRTNAPNDRINMHVQDQGSQILDKTNAIAKVGTAGIEMYQLYQKDKVEQISNVAEQEYAKWNNDQLTKLKSYQGDPTEAFAKYDEAVTQKKKDMLSERAEFGEDVTTALNGRLEKVIAQHSVAADHQRGQQQEIYDNNVFESTVKLKRDNLAVNAGYIQKGDPTSFTMFDQNVHDIKTTVAKRGIKQGTVTVLPENHEGPVSHVYQDDNGKTVKVSMSPMAKARVAKDLSEGVKGSLDVLISTGKIEEARELQQRYGGVLTPAQAAKLEAKYKTAGRKDEAYNVIQSIRGADEDTQIEKIDKIQDPELRSEVLKIKDADTRRIENLRVRKEKANYDTLGSHVLEKMNSDQPFFGMADLEKDPMFQNTWDNLSVKQKQAVTEMVEAPKESNQKSLLKVQNLFMDDEDGADYTKMEPHEFAAQLSGLSKSDRTKYTNMYMSLKTQTEGEKRAMYKSAGSILKNQLLADGHIVPNQYGKLSNEDQTTLINAQNKLIAYMGNQPSLRDDRKIAEFVKQNSAALIKEKVFSPVAPPQKDTRVPAGDGNVKITRQQLLEFQRMYRAENGKFPTPTEPAFEAFVKSKLKKG